MGWVLFTFITTSTTGEFFHLFYYFILSGVIRNLNALVHIFADSVYYVTGVVSLSVLMLC